MKKIFQFIRPNVLICSVVFLFMLAGYTYIYYYKPLSEIYSPYWQDKALDVLTFAPALMAAFLGVQIAREFEYHEPPFRVWVSFAVGWWLWLLGELSGLAYDLMYSEYYPDFTLMDVCWLGGYFFFGLSLYYQFRLIYSQKRQSVFYLAYIGLALLLTAGLTNLAISAGLGEGSAWWIVYISVLYPVFDLAEGGAAIWLSLLFRRGLLGRVWWGLIAFAIADSINIFFWLGGYEWISDNAYYFWDTVSAAAYLLGYMITALAFLAAYNLLRHGARSKLQNIILS